MKKLGKSVLLSTLAALAFGAVAVGTTYALFTSKAEASVTVSTGKVSVKAAASDLKTYSMDAETAVGTFENGGTAALDGTSVVLNNITPGDKVTFKLAVSYNSSVATKYRAKVVAENDTGLYDGLEFSIADMTSMGITDWAELPAVDSETELATYDCSVELPMDAGNEYQETSCKLSYVIEAVQGNANVKNDTKFYSLSEFNALDAIPAEVENVYLHLGKQSLAEGDLIVGSSTLRDQYAERGVNTKQDTIGGEIVTESNISVGSILDSGEKVTGLNGGVYSVNTQKHGAEIYVSGSISGNKDGDGVNDNDGVYCLSLQLPDSCNVTFDGFTVNGYFRIGCGLVTNAAGFDTIEFKNSTFNGIMQQNGGPRCNNFVFDGCTFNNYVNKTKPNDSNPIWIQNPGSLNFVMNDCTISGSRPVKLVEGTVKGNYTFTNNTFDVSYENTGDEAGEDKRVGINFENSTELGDVVISGNTLTKGSALIAFRRSKEEPYTTNIKMKDGATFKVYDNTLNEGMLSTYWKGNTYWAPDFVTFTA